MDLLQREWRERESGWLDGLEIRVAPIFLKFSREREREREREQTEKRIRGGEGGSEF